MLLYTFADFPKINERRNNTIKIKNRIFAIEAAPAAIPPNPKTAAIIAIIRNVTVQRNISMWFFFKKSFVKSYFEKIMPKIYFFGTNIVYKEMINIF